MRAVLSHRTALVPAAAQEVWLRQAVGVSRFGYNWVLAKWQRQSDIGMHEFRRQLGYKARLYGAELVTASRWFPSGKLCSACGRISEALGLSIREWTCECGTLHDRDINAARNLCRYAVG